MNITTFAHAGESHATTAEATAHELGWYIQIPLFIVALFAVLAITYFLTKKRDTTLLFTSLLLLIAGFGLFRIAPIVSATAITLGLIATLFVTLIGLGSESDSKKQ